MLNTRLMLLAAAMGAAVAGLLVVLIGAPTVTAAFVGLSAAT